MYGREDWRKSEAPVEQMSHSGDYKTVQGSGDQSANVHPLKNEKAEERK